MLGVGPAPQTLETFSVAVADFDKDGRPDVTAATTDGNSASVPLNATTPWETEWVTVPV